MKTDKRNMINVGLDAIFTGKADRTEEPPVSEGLRKTIEEHAPELRRKTSNSSSDNLQSGYSRVTYIVSEELIEKVKALAYWERCSIKETMEKVITSYVEEYEKKNGKLKPINK
jgi:hypothetical protein